MRNLYMHTWPLVCCMAPGVLCELIESRMPTCLNASNMKGGMPGAERLRDCATLEKLVRQQQEGGKHLAAICATPAVFLQVGTGCLPALELTG